jgi:hypothetical protein
MIFSFIPKMQQKINTQIFVYLFTRFDSFGYIYQHPPSGAVNNDGE